MSTKLGDTTAGRALLEQSLEICHEIDDRRGKADAILNLSGLDSDAGNYPRAIDGYKKALRVYREFGHRWGEAAAYNNLGCTDYALGQYQNARAYFEQCLTIRYDIDDRKGQAVVLSNLGAVCEALGDFSAAADYQRQALSLSQQLGDQSTREHCLAQPGSYLFSNLGEYALARTNLEQALHIRQATGERHNEARRFGAPRPTPAPSWR